VTEELWDRFGYGEDGSLIRAAWPEPFVVPEAEAARAELDWLVRMISEVRAVRAEMNVPPSQPSPVLLKEASAATLGRVARWRDAIARLAQVSTLSPLEGDLPRGSAQAVLDEATLVLPLAGLIDIEVERARLAKERAKAAKDAEAIARKLDNADFVARAPEEVVDENRERLQAARDEMARLDAALQRIAA
jgi:valyl-tRNA synthetase